MLHRRYVHLFRGWSGDSKTHVSRARSYDQADSNIAFLGQCCKPYHELSPQWHGKLVVRKPSQIGGSPRTIARLLCNWSTHDLCLTKIQSKTINWPHEDWVTEWRFLARKITCFYGPFSSKPCLMTPEGKNPIHNPMKPPSSYGFPMVFLWFSYGFLMVFLWFSYGVPPKQAGKTHRWRGCWWIGEQTPNQPWAWRRSSRALRSTMAWILWETNGYMFNAHVYICIYII